MRAICHLSRPWLTAQPLRCRAQPSTSSWRPNSFPHRLLGQRRTLLTLAIETSCDDTCVALLSKEKDGSATLHYNRKQTSDNRAFGGVHPLTALEGHMTSLADLVRDSLGSLPPAHAGGSSSSDDGQEKTITVDGTTRRKPDFVTVTRGPGMLANLSAGLNTAKGLATAWQVPLLGVNHMQAHALTPRLVTALAKGKGTGATKAAAIAAGANNEDPHEPSFPFLSLLVSGGHTILVHSRALNDHRILASATDIAVGDAIDKAARLVLPPDVVAGARDVMFGPLLEAFAFPNGDDGGDGGNYGGYVPPARRADEIAARTTEYGWRLVPPMIGSRRMTYAFSGVGSQIKAIVEAAEGKGEVEGEVEGKVEGRPADGSGGGGGGMALDERRVMAREAMRVIFEHLASRVVLALGDEALKLGDVRTLVVSGGVASNRFLMHVLRGVLDVRGYGRIEITAPPRELCTDNAAMIAWTGMEMYEAGYESELSIKAIRKWPLDPTGEDGGIIGAGGWIERRSA